MSNDTEMTEAPPAVDEVRKFKQRIRVLDGASTTAASFEFTNEDHTLGNALRHVIMKDDRVEFCGYSIPHPSDPKMNLRIQTWENENHSVTDVLEDGLQRLIEICDVIEQKFSEEREKRGRDDGSEM